MDDYSLSRHKALTYELQWCSGRNYHVVMHCYRERDAVLLHVSWYWHYRIMISSNGRIITNRVDDFWSWRIRFGCEKLCASTASRTLTFMMLATNLLGAREKCVQGLIVDRIIEAAFKSTVKVALHHYLTIVTIKPFSMIHLSHE